jgi:hypothetical protein
MSKNINYLIEYLAKSDEKNADFYKYLLDFLKKNYIYTASKYDIKTLNVLAGRSKIDIASNFDDGLQLLDRILHESMNSEIIEAKEQLLETIIVTNFKKKKEDLDKVETSIYKCITSYIFGLTRALELFYVYTKDDVKEPEVFIEFASGVHAELIEMIFNKEEKELLADKLKEIMGVYLSVYARFLYV